MFTALSDPTRRRVFELLRDGPQAVGELADELPVSRPAVSQHLKVLKVAGLVVERPDGTRRLYSVSPDGVAALRSYFDRMWGDVLDTFAREANTRARRKLKRLGREHNVSGGRERQPKGGGRER